MDAAREFGHSRAFGGLRMKWWRLVLLFGVAAALTIVFAHRADAAAGTPVCGDLPGASVWNAVGSPYEICDGGVVGPAGSTLTLDWRLGAVHVQPHGRGGIGVNGAIQTQAT